MAGLLKFRDVLLTVLAGLSLFGQTALAQGKDVFSIGNPRLPSDGGPDLTGMMSAVFLLDEIFPTAGVFFAFEGYYRNSNPIKLQIWRPTGDATPQSGAGGYKLVGEVIQTPAVEKGLEATYIVSKFTQKCIKVKAGDRFGVYVSNMTSSLSYTFSGTKLTSLLTFWDVTSAQTNPAVGETMEFVQKVFPYDFSISAYCYIDDGVTSSPGDDVDCPTDQLIDGGPKYSTTTTQLPKGLPGATGPLGPMGDTGAAGASGSQGPPGATGLPGPSPFGPVGPPGGKGATGFTGLPGLAGATGAKGSTGGTGMLGVQGLDGPMGPLGPPGVVIFMNESEMDGYTGRAIIYTTTASGGPLYLAQQLIGDYVEFGWASETRMIGAIIWLSILSLIALILFSGLIAITHLHRTSGMGGTLRRQHRGTDSPNLGLGVVYPDGDTSTLSGGRGSQHGTHSTRVTSGTGTLGNYGTSNPAFQSHEDLARRGDGAEETRGQYQNFDEFETRPNWESEMREDSFQNYRNQTATKYGTVRQ